MALELFDNAPLFIAGVFFFGLLFGSFLNVVILRLPARLDHEWRSQCRELLELHPKKATEAPPGVVRGRSYCPSCGHLIQAHENIPLVSYLVLKGRCSACGGRISPRYPAVELATALLFSLLAWQFGPGLPFLGGLVMTGFLIALTGIDIDHQLLPDNLTLPLLWTGLVFSLSGTFTDPVSAIVGAAAGYLFLWSVYHVFRMLTGKEGMGFGDFKLLAALGAWLGWQALPLIILLSSLVGAVVGLALMAAHRHHKDQPLPFGPFIAAAGWITLMWGEPIMAAYFRLSGIG